MKVYQTRRGPFLQTETHTFLLQDQNWDELVNRSDLYEHLTHLAEVSIPSEYSDPVRLGVLPPIGQQEVWASGVTYFRSREARMEESDHGADFYDLVYDADRPELFFKSTAARVIGPGGCVRIRKDSSWNVPEPELTLFLNSKGEIVGYTIGNDMSSRSIEGENPLYLPQAKTYEGSAALGPCLWVPDAPISPKTTIELHISRAGKRLFQEQIELTQLKRSLEDLAGYLFRELSFPHGCYLMTGTGIVPDADFTLQVGDEISISIPPIGTLFNTVSS
ncbi:MAG: fumarylacetoacetate hydrolase family protein [Bacteroidota bacterium]